MADISPGSSSKSLADLKTRFVSAVALAVIALGATWWGGWPFSILWLAAAALVATEWLAMAGVRAYGALLVTLVGVLLTGLWAHDMAVSSARIGGGAPLGLLILPPLACGAVSALLAPAGFRRWMFFAAPYAFVLAATPILARTGAGGGLSLILWLFATVWFTDIAAYFAGRFLGGPKLWPAVSPKKTWSGAIGGAIAGTLAGLCIIILFGRPPLFASWSIGAIMAYTFVASAFSQAGDLGESAMKRKFDVKDSSHLIPGHGGLMDRLDGFWAACLLLGATLLVGEGA